ncbi:hypothetical protein CAI21_04635 [Alkalilimnicola ehrlichii]|uniref:hypothetical protein n=1 Tax=Alkalilimnicola ehrlichii TaxID=351052 RepID=UPI000E2F2B15|nr:hypothetical protein [Alkalilimnicola ehrlichii]RFA30796.1 hypothetical protein CAI21_04635 [Alkalilimnicola ehrlichii]
MAARAPFVIVIVRNDGTTTPTRRFKRPLMGVAAYRKAPSGASHVVISGITREDKDKNKKKPQVAAD